MRPSDILVRVRSMALCNPCCWHTRCSWLCWVDITASVVWFEACTAAVVVCVLLCSVFSGSCRSTACCVRIFYFRCTIQGNTMHIILYLYCTAVREHARIR